MILGQSIVWWWHSHYAAPLLPIVLGLVALTIAGTAPIEISAQRGNRVLLVLLAVHAAALVSPVAWGRIDGEAQSDTAVGRAEIIRRLLQQQGRHLVFVSYARDYSIYDEWVYNPADLEGAAVLMVHDLGPDRNAALNAGWSRRWWRLHIETGTLRLSQYEDLELRASKAATSDHRQVRPRLPF